MLNLRYYLERSGKSLAELSSASEIPLLRLQQLITGAEPSLNELRSLASALDISVSNLWLKGQEKYPTAVLFRETMGKLSPTATPTIELLSERIERSIELMTPAEEPHWLGAFRGPHNNYEDATRDAQTFRVQFFDSDLVSPLIQLPRICVDNMKIILLLAYRLPIDGASALIGGVPFVFVSPRFRPRMLFTLAHEIGHLIAHHTDSHDFAIFDPKDRVGGIRPRRANRERFADAFASCLLLPEVGVGITLQKIRDIYDIREDALGDIEILYLAQVFGVSFQVAARRCEDLNLLPRGAAISLYEEIRSHYGTPEKRARELGLPPRPQVTFPSVPRLLLENAIDKIRRGEVSIGRASEALNLSIALLLEANRKLALENSY